MHGPMGGGPWRRVVVVTVAALSLTLAAACTSAGSDDGPTATLGTAAPATTTTDPYAVPSTIDAAYVNRVLAGLDQAVGDVVRTIVAARGIPREMAERLQAFYLTKDAWQLEIDLLQDDVFSGFAGYKPNPGNHVSIVSDLITVARSCLFAKISRDYSAVSMSPTPASTTLWVGLRPTTPSDDPSHYNKTGWGYVYEGFRSDRSAPNNPCARP
jgi:ABC-type Fe3+-hydroxamate transport system substrate-binding protein